MRAAFFSPPPPGQAPPGTEAQRTPARALRDALEPLATVVFYARPVQDALAGHGLEFLSGYVGLRAAPLGDVPAPVAAAAFGVFEPGLVATLLAQAAAATTREQRLAVRLDGATAALREVLGPEPEGVHDVVAALRRGVAAADLAGRPLFAAHTALPWPGDPVGALWHAATTLRELRGDSHLAAGVAAGLSGLAMNLLTEVWVGYDPHTYAASRGFSPEQLRAASAELASLDLLVDGRLTDLGGALRTALEDATDLAVAPALAAVGPDLAAVTARLQGWSAQVVAAGLVPPDPFKRAAG